MIAARYDIVAVEGNSHRAIILNSKIKSQVIQMVAEHKTLLKLFEIFKSQISENEAQNLINEMQTIKIQINETNDLSKDANSLQKSELLTLTDFIAQMDQSNMKPPVEFASATGKWSSPTAQELELIKNWKHRDAKIDKTIFEAGEKLDRLNDLTLSMKSKTNEQRKIALLLSKKNDEVQGNFRILHEKMDDLMKKSSSFHFTLKLVLTIIILILVSCIVRNVTGRMH